MSQEITTIKLGDSTLQFNFFKGVELKDVLFLNVHEDEHTSIEAITKIREVHNLNFGFIQHAKTRNIKFNKRKKTYEFDPNRIYSFKGRKLTLKNCGKFTFSANREVKKLDVFIKELIQSYKIVVTLHNNSDVNYTINSYGPSGDEAENTGNLFVSSNWDPDDFIYTTHPDFFNFFKNADINVILQNNENCVEDGSLSVFCGKNNIPYINIEAQLGHLEEQIQLVKTTLQLLKK